MSGLLRSVRRLPGRRLPVRRLVVALLTLSLVLGINGFVGAIHSVHHLPAPVETHADGAHDRGHDGGHGQPDPAPGGAPDEPCPMAAAAQHLAATEVAAPPLRDPAPAEAEMVAPRPQDAPRAAWREPGSGRAPPSRRSIPS